MKDGDRLIDVTARLTFNVSADAGAEAVDATAVKLVVGRAKLIDGAGDNQSVVAWTPDLVGVEVLCSEAQGKDDALEVALKALSRCAQTMRDIGNGASFFQGKVMEESDAAVKALFDLGRRDLWDEVPDEEEDKRHVNGGEGG